YRQLRENQAREELHAAIPADVDPLRRPIERLEVGKPDREILHLAGADHADLIVMGVSGHGTVGRLLFGSTTDRVVRQATCPVLTVPPSTTTVHDDIAASESSTAMSAR